jgi:beta-glucanase (GH16 family)
MILKEEARFTRQIWYLKPRTYLSTLIVLFLLVFNVFACKEEDSPVYPSDLKLLITVSEDRSGKVEFVATARDVAYFQYYFGVSASETPVESKTGKATYTYSASGNYTIQVRAYSKKNQYISDTRQITVKVGEDPQPNEGYTTPDSYAGMNLVWRDEFNGTALNESDWTFEIGNGGNGWGNNELEYYTKENTTVKDGFLTITAKKESIGGFSYTSSRIKTQDKKVFKYGRVDIRALLPEGQGVWPALWMLGNNISEVSWPACGELDIMELIGGGTTRDNRVYGTIHWKDANGSAVNYGGNYTLPSGNFIDKFHVFSIIWDASSIKWYVDDIKFHEVDTTPDALSEFQNNFFLLFNVAVGGNWPGSPNASTTFPQKMVVDYVRVFQKQ